MSDRVSKDYNSKKQLIVSWNAMKPKRISNVKHNNTQAIRPLDMQCVSDINLLNKIVAECDKYNEVNWVLYMLLAGSFANASFLWIMLG